MKKSIIFGFLVFTLVLGCVSNGSTGVGFQPAFKETSKPSKILTLEGILETNNQQHSYYINTDKGTFELVFPF